MYHGKNISFLLFSNSDEQTTKLHFRYASHVAFRYKTDCETRVGLAVLRKGNVPLSNSRYFNVALSILRYYCNVPCHYLINLHVTCKNVEDQGLPQEVFV